MCLCLIGFTYQAHAQWTVIDPSNLTQNIRNVIQSSTTASNMVKSLQESVKIYQQSKAYYDALKSVSNLVKDARKVKLTIEMVSEITDIYVSGFNKMVCDPNFTVDELAAISAGYARLLEEGGALVTELKTVVTGGNGLFHSRQLGAVIRDAAVEDLREDRSIGQTVSTPLHPVAFISKLNFSVGVGAVKIKYIFSQDSHGSSLQ